MTKTKTVKENVEKVLAVFPETRGDDKHLLVTYWTVIDELDMDNFSAEFVAKGTMAESIRRARQLIQAEGKYLPPENIVKERRVREASVRKSITKGKVVC